MIMIMIMAIIIIIIDIDGQLRHSIASKRRQTVHFSMPTKITVARTHVISYEIPVEYVFPPESSKPRADRSNRTCGCRRSL